jgi:hypothetical protein
LEIVRIVKSVCAGLIGGGFLGVLGEKGPIFDQKREPLLVASFSFFMVFWVLA